MEGAHGDVFGFDPRRLHPAEGETVGQVEICHAPVFYRTYLSLPTVEINDDLTVLDSTHCFWDTVEYELKIDMAPCDVASVLRFAVEALQRDYSPSEVSHFRSYERHCLVRKQAAATHCVRLGKKGWRIQKAIKIKAPWEPPGRRVSIGPYSESAWAGLIEGAETVTEYPAFYKDKYRYVLVNRQTGSVFGVSGSATRFLSKRYPNKYEIEVEYWSNLLPLGTPHRFDSENERELRAIIRAITEQLSKGHVPWTYPGVKKIDWLGTLYQKL